MSHVTKILTRIIIRRIRNLKKTKKKTEVGCEQCGFVEAKVTNNVAYVFRILTKRIIEVKKDLYVCFIDYTKAFAIKKHEEIITVLKKLNIDGKVLSIIKIIYWQHCVFPGRIFNIDEKDPSIIKNIYWQQSDSVVEL